MQDVIRATRCSEYIHKLRKKEIRARVRAVLDEAATLMQGRSGRRKEVTLGSFRGKVLEGKWGE